MIESKVFWRLLWNLTLDEHEGDIAESIDLALRDLEIRTDWHYDGKKLREWIEKEGLL